MKSVLPNTSTSLLLGAALAGLAGFTPDAEAIVLYTVYDESLQTDLNNNEGTPTVLNFYDFLATGGIQGSIVGGTVGDTRDAFQVFLPSGAAVHIPFSVNSTTNNPYFELKATYGGSTFTGLLTAPIANQTYTGYLDFTVPDSGGATTPVTFYTANEGGNGSVMNYTIGAVPEASTGMLSLAAMAAAALRRRREQA